MRVIAGYVDGTRAPPPTPDPWANVEENDVAIWLVKMEVDASWEIPAASGDITRALYYYEGEGITVDATELSLYKSAHLSPAQKIPLKNGSGESRILILQGSPIEEPVVQYGPFVMNTEAEIQQAFQDYRETESGGWPWERPDKVHERTRGRFARYPDGTEEER